MNLPSFESAVDFPVKSTTVLQQIGQKMDYRGIEIDIFGRVAYLILL